MYNDDTHVKYSDVDMYIYHNHPITIDNGQTLFVKAEDTKGVFSDTPALTLWRWQNKTFDDVQNWDGYTTSQSKEILFRSANQMLCVKP